MLKHQRTTESETAGNKNNKALSGNSIEQGTAPPGGTPNNVKYKNNMCLVRPERCYLASPGRDLFSQDRSFRFGAIPGTDILWDTPPLNIDEHPYPYSGLSRRRAGSHASLWTDQIPDLRIYVVTVHPSPSRVPHRNVQFFTRSRAGLGMYLPRPRLWPWSLALVS